MPRLGQASVLVLAHMTGADVFTNSRGPKPFDFGLAWGSEEGPTDHPGPHLFQEIVRTHQVLIEAFSLEVGMSSARVGVLRQFQDGEDGSVGVVDVARSLGVTLAVVTRQVQEPEAEGLVRRRNASRDRRRSHFISRPGADVPSSGSTNARTRCRRGWWMA